MRQLSAKKAFKEQKSNEKRAKKYPAIQEEFMGEFMYSNPNDYIALKELYESFGFKYSRDLWALQQLAFREANESTSTF